MVFSTELFFIRYNNVTRRVLWVTSRWRVICTCMYLSSLDLTGLPGLLHQNNRVSLRGLCYIVSAWRSTYGLVLLLLHCRAKPRCGNCLLSKYAVTASWLCTTVQWLEDPELPRKAKRQYLLTLQVSRYCLLALQSAEGVSDPEAVCSNPVTSGIYDIGLRDSVWVAYWRVAAKTGFTTRFQAIPLHVLDVSPVLLSLSVCIRQLDPVKI